MWGIFRMVGLVHSLSDQMLNKGMLVLHVVAYLFIIIANIVSVFYSFVEEDPTLKAYEISTIFSIVVYSVCAMIFGLIVN